MTPNEIKSLADDELTEQLADARRQVRTTDHAASAARSFLGALDREIKLREQLTRMGLREAYEAGREEVHR